MKRVIDNLRGGNGSSAKVVDGTLILSLLDAITPAVWRLDLGSVKASSLEVRNSNNGVFTLVLTTPKADIHEIASFEKKQQAIDALKAVTFALEHAHGQIKPATFPASNDSRPHKSQNVPMIYKKPEHRNENKWLNGVIALVILGVLIFGVINIGPKASSMGGESGSAFSASGEEEGEHSHDTGVPISADDFLRNH